MQAFEISHLRLVAGFHQRLKAHADQFHQATAQNGLLAEEIGFAFLTEVGLNNARTPAADARAVGQAQFHRFARSILVHSDQARHAAAFDIFATHGVTGALGGHHDDVNAGLGFDQAEVDVQAMCERNGCTVTNVVVDVFLIGIRLQFVGHGEHDQVRPSGCCCDVHDLQAFAFGLFGRGRTGAQGDHKVLRAAVAQVQRVGVALAAIAQNGDLFVFDQVDVTVTIIIDAHGVLLF